MHERVGVYCESGVCIDVHNVCIHVCMCMYVG